MVWKPDSDALEKKKLTVDGSEVRYDGTPDGDAKSNAMWMESSAEGGEGEWEWNILAGSNMWLGVATPEKFGAGYALKGFLYGGPGNLSDGSSLVTGHWGPKFAQGDKVGMKISVTGDQVCISFSLNGSGLGKAFDISGWGGGKDLRPVVCLGAQGQAVSLRPASGGSFERSEEVGPGIQGDWEGEGVTVSVESLGPNKWMVAGQVGNSMSVEVTQGGETFSAGPVRSTMMMPPPELQVKEKEFSELLAGLNNIQREGPKLRLSSSAGSLLLSWAPGSGPATKDRVNWLN